MEISTLLSLVTYVAGYFWYEKIKTGCGWNMLIPIYNDWLKHKVAKQTKWFWIMLIAIFAWSIWMEIALYNFKNAGNLYVYGKITELAYTSAYQQTMMQLYVSSAILIILCLIDLILVSLGLTKVFNLSKAYAILLVLVPVVGYSLLAWDPNFQPQEQYKL
jgi:hypothetical protein